MDGSPLTLAEWRDACLRPGARPGELLAPLLARRLSDDPAWIHRCDDAVVAAQVNRLTRSDPDRLPLYGVPFAVKDNIDVAGLPTTAACPAFSHVADRNASVVQRLMAAGAVLVGKTNLDQFATGLVGTRSPYGEVPNAFDPAYVSGGSSSGSASVVARGLVAFALGTDTAGSGRVPAGFNNLVGFKPTPGRVGMAGVVPACRTLDVVSVFALNVADAAEVAAVIEGDDGSATFQSHPSRPPWLGAVGRPLRVAVPADPGCDPALGYDLAFDEALARLVEIGAQVEAVPMGALFDVARLLYGGPWVAERYAVVRRLIESDPDAIDPVVRQVIAAARGLDAVAAFEARYRLEDLRRRVEPMWAQFDLLLVPTAPTCPTRAAVAADPVQRNSELGRFTNFVNLLGMAAIALPSGFTEHGLPFGITAIAPGGSDAALAVFGAQWEAAAGLPLGAHLRPTPAAPTPLRRLPAAAPSLSLAVVGAHLQGMPLHGQLIERGCRLIESTTTAPAYRLFALPGTQPLKPGLARVDAGGQAIAVEVYEMPQAVVGSFLALIPPPLGLGSIQLADGRWVKGFICEPAALAGAQDISHFGGWRAWLASR
jgi:allophanate hydrolase